MTALADELRERVGELGVMLPMAQALTHIHVTETRAGPRAQPGSKPPWDAAIAHPLYDAVEGVRRLRADLLLQITGRRAPLAPIAATGASLAAIVRLAHAVSETEQRYTMVLVSGWARPIAQHASIDEEERPVDPRVPCPRCRRKMLLWWRRAGKLVCKGQQLTADITPGDLSGEPLLIWSDGLVQVAPILELVPEGQETLAVVAS